MDLSMTMKADGLFSKSQQVRVAVVRAANRKTFEHQLQVAEMETLNNRARVCVHEVCHAYADHLNPFFGDKLRHVCFPLY